LYSSSDLIIAKAVNVSGCLKLDLIFLDFSVRKATPVGIMAGSGAPNKKNHKKKNICVKHNSPKWL